MLHLLPRHITTTTTPAARRVAALGLVCLLAGAALAEEVHLATVKHVQCATHGEWTHEDALASAAPVERDTASAAPTTAPRDQHDHGDLAVFGHAAELAPRPLTSPRRRPALPASSTPASRVFETSRLWALAPKSSPPLS